MRKIVIAPDSYKGNMRSPEICDIIEKGLKSIIPDINTIKIPMADGGEGTVDSVIVATNAVLKKVTVSGPLGKKVEAEYALTKETGTATMEMASASGIELLKKEDLNPLRTTTYGTGEVIKHILENEENIKEIVIGIGGSATVDGGCGMAQALGYKLLDRQGNDIKNGGANLKEITTISDVDVNPAIKNVKIRVACDVTNPLLGKNGAAKIFGPQKGATPSMVEELECGLNNLLSILKKHKMLEDEAPGDGAAGGLGIGLRAFCNATIESGAELLIEITNLKTHLSDCDLLITGEGCTDGQTAGGKLCYVIAKIAKLYNVSTILLSGALKGDIEKLHSIFDAALSISSGHASLGKAIAESKKDLYFTAQNIAKLYFT
ncbi:MAG: glycerate kinase [Verrucomicrobiota bacterium]|nr:glycerate kinase [Verrucomicrobiota bacterium]